MDEKPDQIIEHIEARRDELGRNLNELENKVRQTTDWHTYYERNPMMILGAALGGGLLLGAMIGGSGSRSRTRGIRSSGSSYKRSTGTSGMAGRSGSYASAGYYTPAESTSSSFANLGSSTGAASHHTPSQSSAGASGPSSSTSTSGQSSSSSSTGSTGSSATEKISNIGSKLQTLAGGQMHQVNEAIDHIRGALIAFGIAKVKEFLSQSVPGLQQHLADADHSGSQWSSGSGSSTGQRSGSTSAHNTGSAPQTPGSTSGMAGSGSGGSDYRSGSQSHSGGSTSYGTGSSVREGNTGPSATSNSGRATEADEYAGVGSKSSTPRQTP